MWRDIPFCLSRLSPLETPLNVNSGYMPPRSKNVNMVANVCPMAKQDNLHLELGKERTLDLRNSTESLDKDLKCGTLQKVKKTYIWNLTQRTVYGSITKWHWQVCVASAKSVIEDSVFGIFEWELLIFVNIVLRLCTVYIYQIKDF